jgi:pimeloyl-ACP methyl ester carboxylesterase
VLGVLRFGRKFTPLARGIKDLAVRRDLVSRIGYAFGGLSRTLTPRKPVEELLRHVDRVDIGMMASLARSYILHSARDILPCVNVPALYLVGEKDSLAPPSHARKVVGVMPSAQAHVLADCTHLALVEKPKEVHALVETFFERG